MRHASRRRLAAAGSRRSNQRTSPSAGRRRRGRQGGAGARGRGLERRRAGAAIKRPAARALPAPVRRCSRGSCTRASSRPPSAQAGAPLTLAAAEEAVRAVGLESQLVRAPAVARLHERTRRRSGRPARAAASGGLTSAMAATPACPAQPQAQQCRWRRRGTRRCAPARAPAHQAPRLHRAAARALRHVRHPHHAVCRAGHHRAVARARHDARLEHCDTARHGTARHSTAQHGTAGGWGGRVNAGARRGWACGRAGQQAAGRLPVRPGTPNPSVPQAPTVVVVPAGKAQHLRAALPVPKHDLRCRRWGACGRRRRADPGAASSGVGAGCAATQCQLRQHRHSSRPSKVAAHLHVVAATDQQLAVRAELYRVDACVGGQRSRCASDAVWQE